MEQLEEWYEEVEESLNEISQADPLFDVDTTKKRLSAIFQKVHKAIALVFQMLPEITEVLPHTDQKAFTQALEDMAGIASVLTKNMAPAFECIAEGGSLQNVLEITEQTLETLYQVARHVYEQQHYEEASGLFCLLSLLNPAYTSFWLGLGNAEYCLGKYTEALLAYSFAAQTDNANPFCHIYCARCHMALNNRDGAKIALSLAESVADEPISKKEISRLKEEIR